MCYIALSIRWFVLSLCPEINIHFKFESQKSAKPTFVTEKPKQLTFASDRCTIIFHSSPRSQLNFAPVPALN